MKTNSLFWTAALALAVVAAIFLWLQFSPAPAPVEPPAAATTTSEPAPVTVAPAQLAVEATPACLQHSWNGAAWVCTHAAAQDN